MNRLTLVLLLVVAGCQNPMSPVPSHVEPIQPPAVYADWWQDVATRVGVDRPMPSRWRVVLGGPWEYAGRTTYGAWESNGTIYLAEGWEMDEGLVRHEMLHHALGGDVRHDHPLFRVWHNRACAVRRC